MMRKVLWFDVETTGTDPKIHDIIQLAFIIEIDGKVKAKHDFNVQPFDYNNIEQEALDINKITIKEIKTFQKPLDLYIELKKIFSEYIDRYDKGDKFYPAGYNVGFDLEFLAQFFIKNEDSFFGSWVNWRRLDPLSLLYILDFKGIISLENYKLETACNYFGIKIKAHNAMADIIATKELFQKLLKLIKEI